MTTLTFIAPAPRKPCDTRDRQYATLRRELWDKFGNLKTRKSPAGKLLYFDVEVPSEKTGQEFQIFKRVCCFHATVCGNKSAIFSPKFGDVEIIQLDYQKEAA